jgi:hypothetical protein
LKFGAGNETRTRDLDLGKVALYQLSYARIQAEDFGAGNETRTRDLDLGKVALYQLSYARIKSSAALLQFKRTL